VGGLSEANYGSIFLQLIGVRDASYKFVSDTPSLRSDSSGSRSRTTTAALPDGSRPRQPVRRKRQDVDLPVALVLHGQLRIAEYHSADQCPYEHEASNERGWN